MAQPTNNTNGIVIDIPSNIPTPIGSNTYFFNASDGNKMYYKQSDGTSLPVTSSLLPFDECLIKQALATLCAWDRALLDGTITITDYTALLTGGYQVTVTNGVDTWTVTIGQPA